MCGTQGVKIKSVNDTQIENGSRSIPSYRKEITTGGTSPSKSGSSITLTKLKAFDNVLSPTKRSKKSLLLKDLLKDSVLSIDSMPSKPVRRRSVQGSTHNASFPEPWDCQDPKNISDKSYDMTTPVISNPSDRKNIFFSKDSSKLKKTLEQVEVLLLDSSMDFDFSQNINRFEKKHLSLPQTRWLSSGYESTGSLRLKQVSSGIHMPSMPKRTTSSEFLV
ncbi:hypothetical protein FisN_13Lh367 [Fistulifera solaris]|uniref:Uncharacterized protein n=1 Tax=Fistulifera solaris TaxID=1519565 RepID=A0A1Z5KMC2_FISSO|nr:hypothetical protein FisN_13Lh367 [Fistulifera solaris]|eukprot:GAX27088.1 hypothetical protein FisN_13Lh367 [Fistulifera solaris]